tara:strand:+ start:20973 stop:22757 length:1785 start_codon:yes stop_codon:yes gene_type:complete
VNILRQLETLRSKENFIVNFDTSKFNLNYKKNCNYIFLKNFKNNSKNFYLFSWSEFANGYDKRCLVSKMSYNYTEKILNHIKKKHFFFIYLCNLGLGKKLTNLTLKKYILNELYNYFFLYYAFEELKKKKINLSLVNFSKNFIFIEKILRLFLNSNKIVHNFSKRDFFSRAKSLLSILFYPLYCIVYSSKPLVGKKSSNLGFKIYKSGFNFKTKPTIFWPAEIDRSLKNKSLLISETDLAKETIRDCKKKNIELVFSAKRTPVNYLNITAFINLLSLNIKGFVYSILFVNLNFFLLSYLEKIFTSSSNWLKFISIFNLKKHITYHDYSFDHIVRNFFFKKINCKTYHYKHTHSENTYSNYKLYNNYLYGYCLYDYEFHWSESSKSMSLADKSQSKNFVITRPLANEYENLNNNLKNKIFTVSFFTSQLGTQDSICNLANHVQFLDFINEYSKNVKVFIILKTKYKLSNLKSYYPEIYTIISKFKKKSNIKIYDASHISAEDLIKKSNVIISMPFSSLTIQGIYNLKPSFYLDLAKQFSNNFFSKNKIYFDDKNKFIKKLDYFYNIRKSTEKKLVKKNKNFLFNTNTNKIIQYIL